MTSATRDPQAPPIRVGCAGLPPRMPRDRYWRDLPFLEADVMYRSPPRRAAIRGWRETAPEGSGISLLAWQAITHRAGKQGYAYKGTPLPPAELAETGGFRDTPTVRRAVEAMAEAVEATEAEAVVFRTPASFAPSAKNRDAMKRFFTDIAGPEAFGGAVRVWEPEGLWRPDEAIRTASELGLILAVDPLARDPLEEQAPALAFDLPREAGYFRITGMGSSDRQIDSGDLEILAEFIEDFDRAWVVFANVAKFADARRFARAIGAAPERPDNG
jgi:uncharacterized protein YecE (DUF72 family)